MHHGTPGSLIKHILITGIETQAGFVAEWQLDRRHLFNSALLKIAVFQKTNVFVYFFDNEIMEQLSGG